MSGGSRYAPKADRRPSKRDRKRELMALARRAGWRGKTFHSAKKFERKLSHQSTTSRSPQ